MTTPAAPTPPPSPQAPTMHLPTISQILLWGARGKRNANTTPDDKQEGSDTEAAESSSAAIKKPVKSATYCIECSSGAEFMTHERIVDAQPECRKSDVIIHQDVFECLDGVDTRLLLRLARKRVFEKVELLGGNAIIDERWSCRIRKHETRRGVLYRAYVTYQGTPARCTLSDPQRPVAIDEAKCVPGLMRVVSRR